MPSRENLGPGRTNQHEGPGHFALLYKYNSLRTHRAPLGVLLRNDLGLRAQGLSIRQTPVRLFFFAPHLGGRVGSEARIGAFLYRYRAAFSAPRPHKPSTHLKTKIPETDKNTDKEPGRTWSHQ